MAIIKCPECGHQVSDHAKVCPSCGIDIMGNITRCASCGELTLLCYDNCPNCHHPLTQHGGNTAKPQQLAGGDDAANAATEHSRETTDSANRQPGRDEKVKKNRHVGAVVFGCAFVFSMALVFLGIYMVEKMDQQNEIDAFERAVASNEPLILNDYLMRYPQAAPDRRDSVEAMLGRLKKIEAEWEKVFSCKNRDKIAAFIEQHPHNMHVKEARLTIDSLDWAAAVKANTVASYEAYLKNYSNQGEHSDEATMKIEDIKARLAAEEQARQDSIADAARKADEPTKPASTAKPTTTAKPATTVKPASTTKPKK